MDNYSEIQNTDNIQMTSNIIFVGNDLNLKKVNWIILDVKIVNLVRFC